MIRSMTGFGKGSATLQDGKVFALEISSVNRKQLEIRFSMPPEFAAWELEARKKIGAAVSRGSVQVRLNVTGGREELADLNKPRLDALIRVCQEYRKKTDGAGALDVAKLLSLPGVLTPASSRQECEQYFEVLDGVLDETLANYTQMRDKEGRALQEELKNRLSGLRELLSKIEPFAGNLSETAKAKILAKLEASKLACDLNDERFQRELLFYADKSDVTEEITRLKSHFSQLDHFLADSGSPAGRSMDFLIQEMFREITTLGNKAGTCDISPLTVAFKAELEKMREQIQNVE